MAAFWVRWSFLLGLCLVNLAGAAPSGPQIPELSSPIIDEAGLIEGSELPALTELLLKLHDTGKLQMVVYIPRSLQGYEIESFSLAAVDKWKLGKKGQDQGLLLTIAPQERKMRFEVGYGLEGDITDAFSRRVLDNTLRPYFQDKRFADGIMVAVEQVAQKLNLDLKAPVENRIDAQNGKPIPLHLIILLMIVFGFFVIPLFFGSRFRNDRWGGGGWGGGGWGGGGFGGGGGGGFSGGGGGFGGGGASSSW